LTPSSATLAEVEVDTGGGHSNSRKCGRKLARGGRVLAAAPCSAFGSAQPSFSRLRIKSKDAQFLIATAGLRDTSGPCHGLLTRGKFQHRETTVERWRPRIASFDDGAIGRYECRRHIFVDAAAKNVDAGGLRLIHHRVSIAAHRLPLAVRHDHRRAGERNQILGHSAFSWEMTPIERTFAELELDGNLSSISASIEGSLPENTASWQASLRSMNPGRIPTGVRSIYAWSYFDLLSARQRSV